MKKLLGVVLFAHAATIFALTPPPSRSECATDLWVRAGSEIDAELEYGLSLTEEIDSKVDHIFQEIGGLESCCDATGTLLEGVKPQIASAADAAQDLISLVEVFQDVDLTRIESKVDNAAAAIEASLQDEFQTEWGALQGVQSTVDVVESKIDALCLEVAQVALLTEGLSDSVSSLNDAVDTTDALVDGLGACCNEVNSSALPILSSKLDAVDAQAELVESILEQEITVTLPRIESKVDAIDADLTVVQGVNSQTDSVVDAATSQVDALGGSIGGGSPCDATVIKQGDFISSTYKISAPGSYCLSEDVSGNIEINADNVTFNLNGHTINGTGSGAVIYINRKKRILVTNGRIKRGTIQITGFSFDPSQDIVFEHLQVSYQNNPAFLIDNASRITISQCKVYQTSTAIQVNGVSGLYILDSNIDACSNISILIQPSVGFIDTIIIKNCVISNGLSMGMRVQNDVFGVQNIQVLDSTISQCRGGILIEKGANFSIKNCLIESCAISLFSPAVNVGGVCLASVGAIKNVAISHCTIVNSFIFGTSAPGINVTVPNSGASLDNVYIGYNTINKNGSHGIQLNAQSGSLTTGIIEYNTILGNNQSGILAQENLNLTRLIQNYSIEHNDLINNAANAPLDSNFTFPLSFADRNTIVANKAYAQAVNGTKNYTQPADIPTIQWQRSTGVMTVVSGGTGPSGWHNWSSIA